MFTEEQLDKVENEVKAEIEQTEQFALDSPEPDPEEALEDVYSQ